MHALQQTRSSFVFDASNSVCFYWWANFTIANDPWRKLLPSGSVSFFIAGIFFSVSFALLLGYSLSNWIQSWELPAASRDIPPLTNLTTRLLATNSNQPLHLQSPSCLFWILTLFLQHRPYRRLLSQSLISQESLKQVTPCPHPRLRLTAPHLQLRPKDWRLRIHSRRSALSRRTREVWALLAAAPDQLAENVLEKTYLCWYSGQQEKQSWKLTANWHWASLQRYFYSWFIAIILWSHSIQLTPVHRELTIMASLIRMQEKLDEIQPREVAWKLPAKLYVCSIFELLLSTYKSQSILIEQDWSAVRGYPSLCTHLVLPEACYKTFIGKFTLDLDSSKRFIVVI